LRKIEDIEVYNPRIRFARACQNGPVYVIESMFPGYLFARFNWKTSLARVHYSQGVSGIVHFGPHWPTVPEPVMADLQTFLGEDNVHEVQSEFSPGDEVELAGGAFHGLSAVVTRVMPGKDRVLVLMEFLGQQTTVDVGTTEIFKEGLRR